ncbi:MAG: glycine zipper 2TM domain-containing protein [Pseudomonadota bacterium]|jgi:hypothetical protein
MNIIGVRGRIVIVAIVATAMLSACATDAQRTQTEGAAAGAVIGAVAGRALGGNRDGAVAGALLGGLVGAVIGDKTADKKARYAAQEDELRASAERATALARASRERNEQLMQDTAALEKSVQRLRTATLSAESKLVLARENQKKQDAMLASVEGQLRQLREETARQSALIKAAETPGKPNGAPQPASEGIRLVSASIRDMDQQTRALELAKLNLQQIDQRRSY